MNAMFFEARSQVERSRIWDATVHTLMEKVNHSLGFNRSTPSLETDGTPSSSQQNSSELICCASAGHTTLAISKHALSVYRRTTASGNYISHAVSRSSGHAGR